MTTKKFKAALYLRVSTQMQVDKDSLPLQESDLVKFTQLKGIDDYVIFTDAGFSGKNTERPAYQEMMSRCRQGEFTHLFVWKLDRISRNLLDFANMFQELKKLDVAFASKNENFDTSTAMGEAMLKIILIFAELERRVTSERVSAVMIGRANEEKWNGGRAPFGYFLPKTKKDEPKEWPQPDPTEAPLVRMIFKLYLEYRSVLAVANIMTEAGYTTRSGAKFDVVQINRIISNTFYKGEYIYNKYAQVDSKTKKLKPEDEWVRVIGQHQPLVSVEDWEKANNIKNNNRHISARKPGQGILAHQRYVLAGFIFCSHCGYAYNCCPRVRKTIPAVECGANYMCQRRHHARNHCDSYGSTSDVALVPTILTFVSRVMEACSRASDFLSEQELQKFLLKGKYFEDLRGIAEIKDLFRAVRSHVPHEIRAQQKAKGEYTSTDLMIAEACTEIKKQERALERLENIYLYDDTAITPEKYIERKQNIIDTIARLNEQVKQLDGGVSDDKDVYLAQLAQLVLIKKLSDTSSDFEYRSIIKLTGVKVLREFFISIIKRIEINNNKLHSLVFQNGITVTFTY